MIQIAQLRREAGEDLFPLERHEAYARVRRHARIESDAAKLLDDLHTRLARLRRSVAQRFRRIREKNAIAFRKR